MAFIDDIKQFFQTGDYPTQSQFYSFFSKIFWRDEQLPISSITDLQTILNGLGSNIESFAVTGMLPYTVAANTMLVTVVVIPVSDCLVTITTTGGTAGDIADEVEVLAAEPQAITLNLVAIAAKNIEITGVPAGSAIKIIKQKL